MRDFIVSLVIPDSILRIQAHIAYDVHKFVACDTCRY